ncbi:hypothetical protein BKH43_07280 [Helicobacter sp. 13S00401-1]|uniref:FUSC family protein n=1 Tax=Helicobacter sp. 13S00401-1 TaxID=1905758 RepID=UPI000BA52D52|nr:FUSC family protein [Helicobacter sp. 13S00401-1]PAF49041.1 hypothetical protein BKH43_07280 [Helicobacter sp. 13S00401-1]
MEKVFYKALLFKAKAFIQKYDPGYFSFVFAIKASISLVISGFIAYYIFENRVPVILTTLGGLYVFFLTLTLSPTSARKSYVFLFVVVSSIGAAIFMELAKNALGGSLYDLLWLIIPIIVLSFIVGMAKAYDLELHKVMVLVIIVALIACLYVEAKITITLTEILVSMPLGGFIAMLFSFFSFTPHRIYGRYIRTHYPLILNHCMLMIKNIQDLNVYHKEREEALTLITNLKKVLESKSGYVKNAYAIKNIQRAIFYIYRIEDLTLSINNLHEYTAKEGFNNKVKKELMHNIMQISDIFSGHVPKIETTELDAYLNSSESRRDNALELDAIKILYSKIKIFSKADNFSANNHTNGIKPFEFFKAFSVSFKSIGWRNEVYRFSVKYSLAVTITLAVATMFDLYRGIWMCFGVVATIRPSVGGLQTSGKEYIFGNIIGGIIGIALAYFTHDTPVFYVVLVIVMFLMIYFRVFPNWLWTGTVVCSLAMLYSIIFYQDYMEFVLQRFIDVLTGFVIAVGVFWAIWPRYSYNALFEQFKKQIAELNGMATLLKNSIGIGSIDHSLLQSKQSEFLDRDKEIKAIIKESKNEKRFFWIIEESEKVMNILDSMLMHLNELTHFINTQISQGKDVYLYVNDLNTIAIRFTMIDNLMTATPHYFRYNLDDKLLVVDDKYFAWVVKSIFDSQDELYTIASKYMADISK